MYLFRLIFVKENFEIIDKHYIIKLTQSFVWRKGKMQSLFSWFLITFFTSYELAVVFFFENPAKWLFLFCVIILLCLRWKQQPLTIETDLTQVCIC